MRGSKEVAQLKVVSQNKVSTEESLFPQFRLEQREKVATGGGEVVCVRVWSSVGELFSAFESISIFDVKRLTN